MRDCPLGWLFLPHICPYSGTGPRSRTEHPPSKVQRNQGHAPAVADSPQEAVSEKIFGSKRSSRCNNHKFLPGYEADEASLRKEGQALGFFAWRRRPWGVM